MKQYIVTVTIELGYGQVAYQRKVFNMKAEAIAFIWRVKRLTPEATIKVDWN